MLYQPDLIILFWLFPIIIFFVAPLAFWGVHSVLQSLRALAVSRAEIQVIPAVEALET